MRLSILVDDASRRSFLKGAVGAVSGGPLGLLRSVLGKGAPWLVDSVRVFTGLSRKVQDEVTEFTGVLLSGIGDEFVDNEYSVVDGMVTSRENGVSFPLAAVFGRISALVSGAWGDDEADFLAYHELIGYGDRSKLDELVPGFVDSMWEVLNKRVGLDKLAALVRDSSEKWADEWDAPARIWLKVLRGNPVLGEFLGVSVDDIVKLGGMSKHGGGSGGMPDVKVLRRLVRKGLFNEKFARGWVGNEVSLARFRKERDESRARWEREVKKKRERDEMAKREAGEELDVPGDYSVAAPMHQYFEGRLRLALGILW